MGVGTDLAAELSIFDLTGDLTDYCEAIGAMWAEVEFFAADTDEYAGWGPLWDVDLMPTKGLPWLAQVVGERLKDGTPDPDAREQIRKTPNQHRGTPQSVIDGVKAELTGAKRLWFRERFNGSTIDEDWITVATYEAETPDAQAVLNALRRYVPADIDINFELLAGVSWAILETPEKSWTTLVAEYGPTWADIAGASPGGVFFE